MLTSLATSARSPGRPPMGKSRPAGSTASNSPRSRAIAGACGLAVSAPRSRSEPPREHACELHTRRAPAQPADPRQSAPAGRAPRSYTCTWPSRTTARRPSARIHCTTWRRSCTAPSSTRCGSRLLARNPAEGIMPPSAPAAIEDDAPHWSAERVGAFLDHVDAVCSAELKVTATRKSRAGHEYPYTRTLPPDSMQRVVWYVMANTGIRRGDACGLRREDVDLDGAMINVRGSRACAGSKFVESAPKTKRGWRRIAIDEGAAAALLEWRSGAPECVPRVPARVGGRRRPHLHALRLLHPSAPLRRPCGAWIGHGRVPRGSGKLTARPPSARPTPFIGDGRPGSGGEPSAPLEITSDARLQQSQTAPKRAPCVACKTPRRCAWQRSSAANGDEVVDRVGSQ